MQDKFILPATVLFVTLATLLGLSGNPYVKALVALALLFGAVSQYIAQDPASDAQRVAGIAGTVGILFAALGTFLYVILALLT